MRHVKQVHGSELANITVRIAEEAVRDRNVPEDVAVYAARATEVNLRPAVKGADTRLEKRARAYFYGVVRRRVLARHPRSVAATRLVVDSIIADLADSGRRPREIWEELCRGWSQSLPEELVTEYRQKLCA